jgi:hypothetical protein
MVFSATFNNISEEEGQEKKQHIHIKLKIEEHEPH